MDKLLTDKSRTIVALLILLCGMLVIAGLVPPHLRISVSGFWIQCGVAAQLLAVLLLIGLAHYLTRSPVSSFELLGAARDLQRKQKESAMPYDPIRIKRLTIRQMNWKEWIPYFLFILAGVGLWVYAVIDAFGKIPLLRMRAIDGTLITAPRWGTVSVEALLGLMFFCISPLFRTRITSQREERFKELLREIDEDTWGIEGK